MAEIPQAAVEAASKVLTDEGGAPGNSIHSWRCEYPDRYGACDCAKEITRAMLAAVWPAGFQAGREAERARIETEIETHAKVWLRDPVHPPMIGDVVWQLRQTLRLARGDNQEAPDGTS